MTGSITRWSVYPARVGSNGQLQTSILFRFSLLCLRAIPRQVVLSTEVLLTSAITAAFQPIFSKQLVAGV